MCCSRPTFGVVIGVLTLIGYVFGIIGCGLFLKDNKLQGDEQESARAMLIALIVVLFLLTSLPVMLIVGILKKRHRLMIPYLVLSAIGYCGTCIRSVIGIIYAIVAGAGFGVILLVIVIQVVILALGYYIIKTIYELYKDIRDEKPISGTTAGIVYSTNDKSAENYYGHNQSQLPFEKV